MMCFSNENHPFLTTAKLNYTYSNKSMFNQILFHKYIIGKGEALNGGYVVDSDYLQIAKYLTWHFLLVFHNS